MYNKGFKFASVTCISDVRPYFAVGAAVENGRTYTYISARAILSSLLYSLPQGAGKRVDTMAKEATAAVAPKAKAQKKRGRPAKKAVSDDSEDEPVPKTAPKALAPENLPSPGLKGRHKRVRLLEILCHASKTYIVPCQIAFRRI